MRYKGKVYRPPSEAYSLIVQVTYGCSHNGCAFCDMYDDKHFAIRPMEEVREDFEMARRVYKKVERVFLADGDALMRKTEELSQILGLIYGLFPECQRVTCYASPTSLQIKSEEDLRLVRSQGCTSRTSVQQALISADFTTSKQSKSRKTLVFRDFPISAAFVLFSENLMEFDKV